MIKGIVGGIGSGKTLAMVKEIKSQNMPCYVNFNIKDKDSIRLKVSHIIKKDIIKVKKDGTPIYEQQINWDYWNKAKGEPFSIFLDEFHNIMHSRQSMTKQSILLSKWISQIRKVLSDSKIAHLYLVSQKMSRIDVAARDLMGEIIKVTKKELPTKIPTLVMENNKLVKKMLPKIYIVKSHFIGDYASEKFESYEYGNGKPDYKTYFLANNFYKYYDTYELIDFGESEYI